MNSSLCSDTCLNAGCKQQPEGNLAVLHIQCLCWQWNMKGKICDPYNYSTKLQRKPIWVFRKERSPYPASCVAAMLTVHHLYRHGKHNSFGRSAQHVTPTLYRRQRMTSIAQIVLCRWSCNCLEQLYRKMQQGQLAGIAAIAVLYSLLYNVKSVQLFFVPEPANLSRVNWTRH